MAPVVVKAEELYEAYEFASDGNQYDTDAYIDSETGRIYWKSDWVGPHDPPPEDLEESDRYIHVPDRRDLNLGRHLVLDFVERELADRYDTVVAFFRRKGAYGRFKGFLASQGKLDQWYTFEESATKEALRDWCEENSIALVETTQADGASR